MKKTLFLLLLAVFTLGMASAVTLAADKTISSDSTLYGNLKVENCVINEGVTLNLNGRGLEIGKSLVLKKNAKITGNGLIIFDKDSSYEGIKLYYMREGKYRVMPLSIPEMTKALGYNPQFMYVSEIKGYCHTGDSQKPTNWFGNPFNEDFNKEEAEAIFADVGKIKAKASLCDIDIVNLSWGTEKFVKDYMFTYKILYKNATAKESYQELALIEDKYVSSFVTDKLAQRSKYTFKFVPVLEYHNNIYEGKASYCNIYTLGAPKSVNVSAISDGSEWVKVSWANLKGVQESGYEIQISKDEEGTDVYKSITVKKISAKSKKVKMGYGKYYYSVRTYKTIDGEKMYSEWSAPVEYEIKAN